MEKKSVGGMVLPFGDAVNTDGATFVSEILSNKGDFDCTPHN